MRKMQFLKEVPVKKLSFKKYRKFNIAHYRQIKKLAKRLKRLKIIHINSTSAGGGVVEMLWGQIAIEKNLGLDSRWLVIRGDNRFFEITKKIHNLLQGKNGFLSQSEKDYYLLHNENIAKEFRKFLRRQKPNLVMIHDPQPLPLINCLKTENIPSLLRIHIDLSTPNPTMLEFLRPLMEKYDQIILSRKDYLQTWMKKNSATIVYPAIDPLAEKNQPLPYGKALSLLSFFNIHIDKPIISQISRFDPWKDPMGVIDAFYRAEKKFPDLQLLLVGFMQAKDDPEAISIFEQVKKHAKGDPKIFLFSDPYHLGKVTNETFVNAAQSASDIVLQKSLREGFGLTVTEAMWKGKAVIGGKTAGIKAQIKHGVNGFLVADSKEAAKYIIRLLRDKKLRDRIGRKARQSVKKQFLLPRLILDHLRLYKKFI